MASFSASGVLASIGIFVFKNIRSKKEVFFAAFPLLFALQQLIEGIIWLVILRDPSSSLLKNLTFAYLVFAYSLWPTLCPLSVYQIEYNPTRKKILKILIALGATTSLYLLFFIVTKPLDVEIVNHSLRYEASVPRVTFFIGTYIVATILPYFISSHRSILFFGLPNLAFCALAYLAYTQVFISTWCFFAAVISLMLYFFLRTLHHEPILPVLKTGATKS